MFEFSSPLSPPASNDLAFIFFSKFNCTDKTVPVYAISFLCTRKCFAGIGRQHTPGGRYKTNRDAWFAVIKFIINIRRDALKAVDLSPGYLPAAKFTFQFFDGGK